MRLQLELEDHVLDQFGQRKRFTLRQGIAGIELGQFEQIANQLAEMFAVFDGGCQVDVFFVLAERCLLDKQRFEVALQRGQRGTQIVRDVGDQFASQRVAALEVVHLCADQSGHAVERCAQAVDFVAWMAGCELQGRRFTEIAFPERIHRRRQAPQPACELRKNHGAGSQRE